MTSCAELQCPVPERKGDQGTVAAAARKQLCSDFTSALSGATPKIANSRAVLLVVQYV